MIGSPESMDEEDETNYDVEGISMRVSNMTEFGTLNQLTCTRQGII